MMNARKTAPLLALAALIAILALPAHGQTGIIVNNADAIRQEGISLGSVTGNTMRQEWAAPPAGLQTLFGQEMEAQALRLRTAAETVKTSLPGLSLRLGLVGPADGRARPWPAAGPDPAAAQVGAARMQAVLGQIVEA